MSETFEIAERIAADSIFVAEWPLCQLRLMDDRRYPWLLLLPRKPGLEEWTELPDAELAVLAVETKRAGLLLGAVATFDKLNVGALGNIVRQMHVHVIGRSVGDAAWPGPVWGQGTREPYPADEREALISRLQSAVAKAG
ncbi:diadenosine tetraphosphate hydrolase [Kaistia sp. 32K]|uniref:HIT domain-containing protein n=1 Tax=Kaistia sp. 32K TaxID=2795690 RepID=UPI001916C34E|nr:HIT domain-containing protein [Kaistia sp. 32K]BCP54171.1 diadenosine tetraphosphate hydrolase [Kaistia sp. 32K]